MSLETGLKRPCLESDVVVKNCTLQLPQLVLVFGVFSDTQTRHYCSFIEQAEAGYHDIEFLLFPFSFHLLNELFFDLLTFCHL